MPLKTLLFLAFFCVTAVGGIWHPLWSLLGYIYIYIVGPEGQWWFRPIQNWPIRYSQLYVIVTAIGILANYGKLRFGTSFFTKHEVYVIFFLIFIWVLRIAMPETTFYSDVDHPTVKLLKVLVFCFMVTHVVTDMRSLKTLLLFVVMATLMLGIQAYMAPGSTFQSGRLEGIGGSDFTEANFLPGFIGAVLPIIAYFIVTAPTKYKIAAIAAAAFAINTVVLTRSRGAFVGFGFAGLASLILAPREYRKIIWIFIVLGIVGGVYLMDEGFKNRMFSISTNEETMGGSSRSRIDTWKASLHLLEEHPFGCGPGNFKQVIGNYDSRFSGRDAHSTVVRCYSELGYLGFMFFILIIFNALMVNFNSIKRARKLPAESGKDFIFLGYAFSIGLFAILGVGLFVTLLYVEFLWWWVLFPVSLNRAVINAETDFSRLDENKSDKKQVDT